MNLKAFSLYEIEDTGYINVSSLNNVFEYMGLDTKSEDYAAIIQQVHKLDCCDCCI